MRINELIGYKSNSIYNLIKDLNSVEDIVSTLRNSDYKKEMIGYGTYGVVFSHHSDPNNVIKLFSSDDTGYKKYLNFVLSNQDNPHVPKVRGRPVSVMQKRMQILRLERLREYNENNPTDEDFYDDMFYFLKFIKDYNADKTTPIPDSVEDLFSKYPKIYPVAMLMAENINSNDFHEYNFMFRENVPVITDPFSDFVF
jgi:hypothetical protein